MHQIQLLGQFTVISDGQTLSQLNHPRLQELLAYLALHAGQPVSRQQLAFLFWPDSSEAQARSNLRNLLHRLLHAFPACAEFILRDENRLQWQLDERVSIDVQAFQAIAGQALAVSGTARRELLEQAIRLYRGDLLPECYSDWLLAERERLRGLYHTILLQRARLAEEGRDYPQAIATLNDLLALDPLNENAYAWLMRLHALDGDRGGALLVYHTCLNTLARELGVEPAPDTQRLYAQIMGSGLEVARVAPATELIARQTEWSQLTRAWRDARGGQAVRLFLIRGEAGAGKTHLAKAFIDWLKRQGERCFSAAGYESARELAYAPLAGWLKALYALEKRTLDGLAPLYRVEIARLLPELRLGDSHLPDPAPLQERWQLIQFYESLLAAFLSSPGRVLLFLDDLQWCDPETLAWLAYLASNPQAGPIHLLVTLRSETLPGESTLAGVFSVPGQRMELELERLDEGATAELGSHLLGARLLPGQLKQLYQFSEGNPLFITEWIRAGLETFSPEQHLPGKVKTIIEGRLSQLSSPARQVIEVGAVIGRSFSYTLLQVASGMEEQSLVEGLDECWRQRILREQGAAGYDFGHELLREAAYAGLSQARRRWLHGAVARALEGLYTADLNQVAESIAGHLELAGQAERASAYYEQAAQVAEQLYALPRAIALTRRAIALHPIHALVDPVAARQYEALGYRQLISGAYEEARQALRRALDFLESAAGIAGARLQRRIAQSWSSQQRYAEAGQSIDAALAALGEEPPPGDENAWRAEWLELRLFQVDYLYFKNDPPAMQMVCDLLEGPLEQYGSLAQRSEFCTLQGMLRNRLQRYSLSEETVRLVRRALELAEQTGDPLLLARKHFGLGFNLLWHGDRRGAIDQLEQALALADRVSSSLIQNQALAYLSVAYRMEGDPQAVGRLAQRGLELARSAQHPTYQGVALSNQAWLAYRSGDWGTAEDLAKAAAELWGYNRYPMVWLAELPLAALAIHCGDLAAARTHLATCLEEKQQRLPDELDGCLHAALSGEPANPVVLAEALDCAVRLGYL